MQIRSLILCSFACLRVFGFPDNIPIFKVRKDLTTNEPVSRGRLHLINYEVSAGLIPPNNEEQKKKMTTFEEFNKHLQCASAEQDMDGTRGSWTMTKMAQPTVESLLNVCAFAETKCHPWIECSNLVEKFSGGGYDKSLDDLDKVWGLFRGAKLLRVIDNEVYYDWPWGIERLKTHEPHYSGLLTDHMAMLEIVLRIVSDIGNSVFFFGGERAFLKWNVPFPAFSFAPTLRFADMPFPWKESYVHESSLVQHAEHAKNFTDAFFKRNQKPWAERIPKAAFFSSLQDVRQVVYDAAALRPDLLDVSFPNTAFTWNPIEAWNPLSHEDLYSTKSDRNTKQDLNRPGFIQPIVQFHTGRSYNPTEYKYVIVPVGSHDESSSGRLAGLLAHSGAVVLMQMHTFAYHFSARLVPWVHYVPLSYSMSDVIEKVEWLKNNEDKAQQIMRNAENFGKSYLRLEDHLCYVASSLRLIHDLEAKTDVLTPFTPQLIHRIDR